MGKNSMEIFFGIAILTFGMLNIILFFKLWGMANNVKKMTKIMESNQVHSDEFWTDSVLPEVKGD